MHSTSRRAVLGAGLGIAAAGALSACSGSGSTTVTRDAKGMSGMDSAPSGTSSTGGSSTGAPAGTLVSPDGPQVRARDRQRSRSGHTVTARLTAASATVDLGGPTVRTWAYDGRLPFPQIRMSAGDTLVARLANHLTRPTSIHWHGVALRDDMDGVPPITQPAVAPGADFTYRFTADAPGTYWFHPHVGLQRDRGLYGALIVEDPHEPLSYDDEWVVVLDDWLDGVHGASPEVAYAQLRKGMSGMSGMSGMDSGGGMSGGTAGGEAGKGAGTGKGATGGSSPASSSLLLSDATSPLLGGDAGDVKYPYYLVNGRVPAAPEVYSGKPGKRLRIRMVNAGGDTAFRVALGGHRMTVTHTDGYPVEHQRVDAVLIAPGERYDVLVTLGDGVFPLTALAEGKNAAARALVRTGSGSTPPASARPAELDGRILAATALRAASTDRIGARRPDVVHRIELTGSMTSYDWALDGRSFDIDDAAAHPFTTRQGQRVRIEFVNRTTMWHPMHLHGHTFQLGASGARKDTVIVLPGRTVACDLDADNPGRWLLHCHNVYHGAAGMMGLFGYVV